MLKRVERKTINTPKAIIRIYTQGSKSIVKLLLSNNHHLSQPLLAEEMYWVSNLASWAVESDKKPSAGSTLDCENLLRFRGQDTRWGVRPRCEPRLAFDADFGYAASRDYTAAWCAIRELRYYDAQHLVTSSDISWYLMTWTKWQDGVMSHENLPSNHKDLR